MDVTAIEIPDSDWKLSHMAHGGEYIRSDGSRACRLHYHYVPDPGAYRPRFQYKPIIHRDDPSISIFDEDIGELIESCIIAKDKTIVPGKGLVGTNCGTKIWMKNCTNCGAPHFVNHQCKSKTCPNCELIWRHERTRCIFLQVFGKKSHHNNIIHEMKRIGQDLDPKIPGYMRIQHVVFSPPAPQNKEEGWTKAELDKFFRQAEQFAKLCGFIGGCVLFHPFRTRGGDDDSFNMGVKKKWKEILKRDDWQKYIYFSPHFHGIVITDWMREIGTDSGGNNCIKTDTGDISLDGWVVKRIRDVKKPKDVMALIMYLLSHVGCDANPSKKEGQHAKWHPYRYFGELAPTKFSSTDLPSGELRRLNRLVDAFFDIEPKQGEKDTCLRCGFSPLIPVSEVPNLLSDPEWMKSAEHSDELKIVYDWHDTHPGIPYHSEEELWLMILRNSHLSKSVEIAKRRLSELKKNSADEPASSINSETSKNHENKSTSDDQYERFMNMVNGGKYDVRNP